MIIKNSNQKYNNVLDMNLSNEASDLMDSPQASVQSFSKAKPRIIHHYVGQIDL